MKTELAERLGVEYPIFAFTHCRDVAAAVTNAGGVGVLGTTRQSLEELEYDLVWMAEHCKGRPYAVDLLFPVKTVGDDEVAMAQLLPEEHKQYIQELMDRFGIRPPKDPDKYSHSGDNLINTNERARQKMEIIRSHEPQIVASALGPAPEDVVEEVHGRGGLVIGLVGAPGQASKHVAAGTD